jgi:hypothetical protein
MKITLSYLIKNLEMTKKIKEVTSFLSCYETNSREPKIYARTKNSNLSAASSGFSAAWQQILAILIRCG